MSSPSCFVTTISLDKVKKLEEDLITQGFSISRPPSAIFQAQKQGVSCTLYPSGKLTVQGKEKHDFLVYYLEPEIMESLDYSNPEIYLDMRPRIGIDEAGKGDFFGPLCIAGVQANQDAIKKLLAMGVKDSKKLSDTSISVIAKKIKQEIPHSIVRISPLRYNQLYESFGNLNSLLGWGHATAIEELAEKTGCKLAVIDKFAHESIVIRALERKKITLTLEQKHRAEEDPVVAAASILARAAFVEGIDALSKEYGMEIPKGASNSVVKAGIMLYRKYGEAAMLSLAKMHFKTMEEIRRAETTHY